MSEIICKTIKQINEVTGTNNSKVYNSHLYWSQKPYNICDILINNLSNPGDVICDPFMGSGVTIFEAIKTDNNRKAIGVEINDYPIYLLKTLLGKYDIDEFCSEAKKVIKEIEMLCSPLYETICPKCGSKLQINKSLFQYDNNNEMVLQKVYCKCNKCKQNIEKIDNNDIDLFVNQDISNVSDFKNINLIPDSRIAVRENETLFDIFTKRNIVVIDKILGIIKNNKYYNLFIYSLIGVLHLAKITDPKSSSQWPLWTPKKDCIEKNVVVLFEKSIGRTIDALKEAQKILPEDRKNASSFSALSNDSYYILKEGIQFVGKQIIPDESVDLIITDPPYMGQVIYSEYMQLYQPFLNNVIEYDKEIIVIKTKSRTKTENDYFNDMNLAFNQISRMLKQGKYLCLYFHDASLKIWSKLISVLAKNNLVFENSVHVNKGKSTLKNIVSPKKSMNGDAILFFKKCDNTYEANELITEDDLVEEATRIITRNGGVATTAKIYDDGLLSLIIKNGLLEKYSKKYSDLTELFAKHFNWNEKGYWSL